MVTQPITLTEFLAQPFSMHVLNSYTNTSLSSMARYFDFESEQMRRYIRVAHHHATNDLANAGVNYEELKNALIPIRGRREVAFLFDSTVVESGFYGLEVAKLWLPAVQQYGPDKTVIRNGDIILPPWLIWQQLETLLISNREFPRLHASQYFVVYLTNLSATQLRTLDAAFRTASDIYIGYVDCSTWNPLKAGMLLPQVGLRVKNKMILGADQDGDTNAALYPIANNGFQVIPIREELYDTFLTHRLDNGVPEWADDDSVMALSVLGGNFGPVSDIEIRVESSRLKYLVEDHGDSIDEANVSPELLGAAITEKLSNNLIYNLRLTPGSHAGEPDPNLDAMMFTVQVEFQNADGEVRRYQAGIKYRPETHTGELVTFY